MSVVFCAFRKNRNRANVNYNSNCMFSAVVNHKQKNLFEKILKMKKIKKLVAMHKS